MSISSVFITGANRGLGLEFVKQFVSLPKPPNLIFATCRNPDNAEDLQKLANSHSSVRVLKLDVKDTANFPSIVKEVSKAVGENGLNLLLNNAGIAHRDRLGSISKENMIESYEVNVISPLLLSQELLPLLKKAAINAGGNKLSCCRAGIVNITSKMGSIDDNTSGGTYPYRASKTALNMVTKSLAVDAKSDGILAFVVHPGWVVTDMGGPNGLINTETSVKGMLNVILNSSEKDLGLMLNYDGKVIPW